ncbi:MAG: hypothetical protein EBV30_10400 [Actinobacteria bacterium]|nr:hypothetical protein [Actinomycetota bacterium]
MQNNNTNNQANNVDVAKQERSLFGIVKFQLSPGWARFYDGFIGATLGAGAVVGSQYLYDKYSDTGSAPSKTTKH